MPRKERPSKPYPDFPLSLHPTGQWCKKIKGRLYYFGKDADSALTKYLEDRDDLQAGRTPRSKLKGGLTVVDMVNQFLTSKKTDLGLGTISARTFNDYYRAGDSLSDFFHQTLVANLRPDDFDRYKAKLSKTRGVVSISNSILRTRIIFNWAFQNELIDKPVRFGTSFKQPNKTALRRAKTTGKTFEADELRTLINAANQPLKAMILLGINCGFGQTDVANLPVGAIDLKGGWIQFPRPKTAIPRRAPLWPETLAALQEAIADRPKAKDEADGTLAFITQRGACWIRGIQHEDGRVVFTDAVAQEFRKLLLRLKLKRRGSFYNLRHTFATSAASANDREAADLIMGHTDPSMGAHYVERFPDARLKAVTDCVHNWLFAEPKNESTEADSSI